MVTLLVVEFDKNIVKPQAKGVSQLWVSRRIWYYFYCLARSEKFRQKKKCSQKTSYNSLTTYSDQKRPGANLRSTVTKMLVKFGVQRTGNAIKY